MIFQDVDKGDWSLYYNQAGDKLLGLQSDDFKHDVTLEVHGDFGGLEDKREYCELLETTLNKATELQERIALLEAVAEAAVIVCQLVDEKSSMVYGLLERPLRAAGYLND